MSGQQPGRARAVGLAALWLGGTAAVLGASAAWTTVAVARQVVTPSTRRIDDVKVLGVDGDTLRLSARPDAVTPGRYSFWFDGDRGHARVGDVTDRGETWVERRVLGVDFGDLSRARRGRFAGWLMLGPRALGLPYESVSVETPVGPAPAWHVPAADSTGRWAVLVHGRGVRRQEALRAVPALHAAGWDCLLVSYRNDGDAPASDDGRYGLGLTEWVDVDAAMRFAVERGATELVLGGWSMGGAIVLQTVTRSALADRVRGLLLDSPVVDWRATLDSHGRARHLPAGLTRSVYGLVSSDRLRRVVGQSAPLDFDALDFVRRADDLHVPILLMHSDDDGYVPIGPGAALAELRPDIVTFERFTVATHTKLWNFDPGRWDRTVTTWLASLR
jgi:uncharacterized protein